MAEAIQLTTTANLYCTFWLGGQRFGVPAATVSEIHSPVPLTPIPGAPAAVCGYVNLRGQLFLVLDPAELLLDQPQSARGEHELVVFQAEVGEAFAIGVERVGEVVAVAPSQIHIPRARTDDVELSSQSRRARHLVVGHATHDEQLLMLLDARELLPAAFATTG